MPIVPRSPDTSIHSWSLVYLSPGGYGIVVPYLAGLKARPTGARPALPRALVKRQRHDARAGAPAADIDVELGFRRREVGRHVRHADRFLQIRRLGAARDPTDRSGRRAAGVDIVPMPRDSSIEHLEPDELPADAVRFLVAESARADEVRLLPPDDPREVGLHSGR